MLRFRLFAAVLILLPPSLALGADWPQWRGPARDGRSAETGLDWSWPEDGPRELWRIPVGKGYSPVVAVGERIFTLWAEEDGEYLVALAAETGRELWRVRVGDVYPDERGDGPRSSPLVEEGTVYALGGRGGLVAVATGDGALRWRRELVEVIDADEPHYGFATSPLAWGELLLILGGDAEGETASLAAFRKTDGELAWRAFPDALSYSSPVLLEVGGRPQAIFVTGDHVVGVASGGEVLWSHPWDQPYNLNVATPVVVPPDRVFVSTGYDMGGTLLRVLPREDGMAVEEVWHTREMKNHFHSSVLHQGYLYGFDNATLKAMEVESGETRWRHRGLGKGSLIFADGRLIVLGERGELVVAPATPDAFEPLARLQVLEGRCWTGPVLAHGRLFLRNEKELVALDLRPEGKEG